MTTLNDSGGYRSVNIDRRQEEHIGTVVDFDDLLKDRTTTDPLTGCLRRIAGTLLVVAVLTPVFVEVAAIPSPTKRSSSRGFGRFL